MSKDGSPKIITNKLNWNQMNDAELIQEVINFLIDNEQYGDDWTKHIETLTKLRDQIKEDSHEKRSKNI